MSVYSGGWNENSMNVIYGLSAITQAFPASTVAIGTFDGVHIGHQAIVRTAIEDAQRHQRPALIFTFDRHPAELIAPERVPGYLTTPSQRIRLLSELNPSSVIIAHFDMALSQLSPDDFVQGILKEKLNAQAIVVGKNFLFGQGRSGDVAYLERERERFGYRLYDLDAVEADGEPASSTRIRELLRQGEIAQAERILGHPYYLAGEVVKGQQLGRTLGFPTANLSLEVRQVVPLDGIYAVQVTLGDGRVLNGACSIGNRPTIEDAGHSIETYLLDFDEDIYGRKMEIRFVKRLREERKYDSLDALVGQIERDVSQAREILG
ncbi:MAG: bifunctional riboflavin kinase/FAD synthetase [Armatimonadetes bacterium]|nr:bifunctional riboflavin kinase/FAD synthetase [Armatimonadota bacterium]